MTDEEVAKALEKEILGGEPFYYSCGCFGVIVEVHKHNANWVRVYRTSSCGWVRRLCYGLGTGVRVVSCKHMTPDGYVRDWRKRDGGLITVSEWAQHIEMSEYVYGR